MPSPCVCVRSFPLFCRELFIHFRHNNKRRALNGKRQCHGGHPHVPLWTNLKAILFLEMDTALLLLVWCFCANESIKFAGWCRRLNYNHPPQALLDTYNYLGSKGISIRVTANTINTMIPPFCCELLMMARMCWQFLWREKGLCVWNYFLDIALSTVFTKGLAQVACRLLSV